MWGIHPQWNLVGSQVMEVSNRWESNQSEEQLTSEAWEQRFQFSLRCFHVTKKMKWPLLSSYTEQWEVLWEIGRAEIGEKNKFIPINSSFLMPVTYELRRKGICFGYRCSRWRLFLVRSQWWINLYKSVNLAFWVHANDVIGKSQNSFHPVRTVPIRNCLPIRIWNFWEFL